MQTPPTASPACTAAGTSLVTGAVAALLHRARSGMLFNVTTRSTHAHDFDFWQGYARALNDFTSGIGHALAAKDAALQGYQMPRMLAPAARCLDTDIDRLSRAQVVQRLAQARIELTGDEVADSKLESTGQLENGAVGRTALRSNSLKEILEAAEVTHPKPGQQLTAVLLRRAYESEASVILVDSAVMASINAMTSEADASGGIDETETELKTPTSKTACSATGTNAANHYASLSEFEKDELLAAVVTTPRPGQLLAAVTVFKGYRPCSEVVLVDINQLVAYGKLRSSRRALLSAPSSAKMASTSEVDGWLNKVVAIATAVASRSKTKMAGSTPSFISESACSSASLTRNAFGVASSVSVTLNGFTVVPCADGQGLIVRPSPRQKAA